MAITLPQLHTLTHQLPLVQTSEDCKRQHHQQQTTPIAPAELNSYLEHYHINFTRTGLAKQYSIWRQPVATHRITSQCWSAYQPRGTLFIIHGYLDHCALYKRVIDWALTHQLNVVTFDLPGHGLSSGTPAAIDSFDEYTRVLKTIINHYRDITPAPYYSLGQSTGCAVIADYLLSHPEIVFKKNVLLAPLVRCRAWSVLRWVYFSVRPLIKDIKRNFSQTSHDREFQEFLLKNDPLQAKRIKLSWLGAMDAWIAKVKQAKPVNQDIMIIQGDEDSTVDWAYNLLALQHCFPNHHTQIIPGAEHRLANEALQFWQPVADTLERYF